MSATATPASQGTPSPTDRLGAMVQALPAADPSTHVAIADRWPAASEHEPTRLDDSLRRALEALHDFGRP